MKAGKGDDPLKINQQSYSLLCNVFFMNVFSISKKKITYGIFFLTTFLANGQQIQIVDLRVNHLLYPHLAVSNGYILTGAPPKEVIRTQIHPKQLVLGWQLTGGIQAAYRVIVSSQRDSVEKGIGDVWDSGRINSGESVNILYQGQPLQLSTGYTWRVMIWNEKNESSPWSPISEFYTADAQKDYQTAYYPLQKTDEWPRQIHKLGDVMRIDFGKACFGQLRFTLSTTEDKASLTVRLGEAIHADGSINRKPGGTIRYAEYRIPLQRGRHTYHLQFKADKRNTGPLAVKMPAYIGEVLPFRYVELEGKVASVKETDITRSFVHYPFDDFASHFESSDSTLNAIWELCKYSVKVVSFAGLYMDGDRERIPYEVDAYINQLSHYNVDSEYGIARRSLEYMIKHGTWFTDCILYTVPMVYNDYLYTGNLRIVQHYYDDLKAKLLIPLREPNGLMSTRKGKQSNALKEAIHLTEKSLSDLVDWPHAGGFGTVGNGETDGFVFTDYNTVVNAIHYKALRDMTKLANALGKKGDVEWLNGLADETYRAFHSLLWDSKRRIFRDGVDTDHASLHANMIALAFNLVPAESIGDVMTFIRSRGMACGPYGSQLLMDAIYKAGDADYGLSLLTSKSERSWYNMIRSGSTVTMEAWDQKYKSNLDWNHAWGTVPANAIPRKLMGVEPLEPGWKSFSIKPQIGSLTYATVRLPTIRGTVEVVCRQNQSSYHMKFTVPGNTLAKVELPVKEKKKWQLTINGKPAKASVEEGWLLLPEFAPGSYDLVLLY